MVEIVKHRKVGLFDLDDPINEIFLFQATTTCTPNLCGAHGTCQQLISNVSGLIAHCICDSQWTGRFCDSSLVSKRNHSYEYKQISTIDSFTATCTPNYCQGGSTCVTTASGAVCICAPGFTGQQCQTYTGASTMTTSMMTTTTSSPIISTRRVFFYLMDCS